MSAGIGPPPGDRDSRAAGWSSDFPRFRRTSAIVVRTSLERFVQDVSTSQLRAWDESIPKLQSEAGELVDGDPRATAYTAILEYELPLEARRTDVVFLVAGAVVVLELKGKARPEQADLDQAAAYARDLRAYHRECQDCPVHAVLVPMRANNAPELVDGVWVTGPRQLDALVRDLATSASAPSPNAERFLAPDAYRPLPTLVQAARELFHSGDVREVWRARAATEPAVERISEIAHEAAASKTRRLVLVTGVPGSGKTLVGMRAVHARSLDDLAIPRAGGTPTVPALFLSGNGPLVQVLQHVLKGAGGGGRTFVRHIKDYLDRYVPRPDRVPDEHLLVFDEAQRAFTSDKVRETHKKWPEGIVRSEPQHFVDLCERMPEWSVLVGLIGTGQEIHVGEEGGLIQWCEALRSCREPSRWSVHAPAAIEEVFLGSGLRTKWELSLNLDTEIRFHTASDLHVLVANLLEPEERPVRASLVAERSPRNCEHVLDGLKLWITRDLLVAKSYLRERYDEQPLARFGLLASSRDKLLIDHGVDNTWHATSRVALGPWYADGDESPLSCRRLDKCITEFGAQGLELDMVLLAWGSDLIREGGRWTDVHARGYARGPVAVRDPFRLRQNAYRVLLTRGRDGTVVFVPAEEVLDETWAYLLEQGFRELR